MSKKVLEYEEEYYKLYDELVNLVNELGDDGTDKDDDKIARVEIEGLEKIFKKIEGKKEYKKLQKDIEERLNILYNQIGNMKNSFNDRLIVEDEVVMHIPGTIEYYATYDGRIYNARHKRYIKSVPGVNEYEVVNIKYRGKRGTQYTHRLVASAWLDNPDNLPEIDHIDYDKSNNRIDNLRYISRADNLKHSKDRIVEGLNRYWNNVQHRVKLKQELSNRI